MNCSKCGKEIPDGENKICEECQKKLLAEIENDNSNETEKKEVNSIEKKEGNKNLVIIMIVVAIIALISTLLFIFRDKVSEVIYKDNSVGNSIANIRNYGYTAEQGGWIYYIAPSQDGKQDAIYKSKKDGSDIQVLQSKDWEVLGLNVVGDYIYFIGLDDQEVESSSMLSVDEESKDTLNNKIYRMKLDGSDLEVINSNEFHNNCYEIYVIEDKVYYIGIDSNIYYMNLDGSEKTKLNDDQTGYLGITKDYIILNIEKAKEGEAQESASTEYETYIMNRDGSNKHALTGERLYSINVVEDYIYYVNTNKEIYKVKMDGSDNVQVAKDVTAYNMNIKGKYIYYMNYITESENQKIGIYRMNLDGTDNKLIHELDSYSTFINTIDVGVTFRDTNEKLAKISLINEDGEDEKFLFEFEFTANDQGNTTNNVTPESNSSTENNTENTNNQATSEGVESQQQQ